MYIVIVVLDVDKNTLLLVRLCFDVGCEDSRARLVDRAIELVLQLVNGLMLVSPDHQVHPIWDVSRVERLMDGGARSKPFLIPILMEDKDVGVILDVALWFLKGDFFLFEQFVEDLVFDVAEAVEGDLAVAPFLGDYQGSYDYLVEVEMLAEVGHIVASLQ